ncbi:MAG TPA: D-glycerate dehydrogenase [Patescibacteria group bacterium]
MPKIFVTRAIPDAGIKMLRAKKYQVKISPYDRVLKREEIIRMAKGADALLCLLTDKIDSQLLDILGPKLKIVANYAVGFDNIDVKACQKHNVYATNTSGVLTRAVAEHTFALMMAIARRISEADRFVRAGQYVGWDPFLMMGSDVEGKTLGIIGLGRIGRAVAQRAVKGLGMKVLYFDVSRQKDFEKQFKAKFATVNKILKTADFVTIHVPLLPGTKHLIGARELRLMKKTAYLVNTSRGPVIDEKALAKALRQKEIAGAGIDVFEFEPRPVAGLKKLDNIIMTPHIASATIEARQEMSRVAAKNIIFALSGGKPPNLVY